MLKVIGRVYRQSPRLLGSPLQQWCDYPDNIGASAGVRVLNGVTSNAVGTANVAANQNQEGRVTQLNVPVDLEGEGRETVPEGLTSMDVCIEEVSIENDGTSDATERQVVSAGFASTLAITTPGTGLQYEDEEGNVETSGDFTD